MIDSRMNRQKEAARLTKDGKGALIPIERGYTCPAVPGQEVSWGSCRGCKHRTSVYLASGFICTHPKAARHSEAEYAQKLKEASEYECQLRGDDEPAAPPKRAIKKLDHGLGPKKTEEGQFTMF